MSFRTLAIVVEVIVLTAVIYCFILGARLTLCDIGLRPSYDRFLKWTLGIVVCLICAFFIAHLTLFYPRLFP